MEANDSIQAKDFSASKAAMGSPLGYINEFSVDLSRVGPPPKASDGLPMVFIWGPPQKRPLYKSQGVLPVPGRYFSERPPGGTEPLSAVTSSLYITPDGDVTKEGKMGQLFWTTTTNYRRMQAIQSESAQRMQGGAGKFAGAEGQDEAYLRANGIETWTEEEFSTNVVEQEQPRRAAKKPAISMAGLSTPTA